MAEQPITTTPEQHREAPGGKVGEIMLAGAVLAGGAVGTAHETQTIQADVPIAVSEYHDEVVTLPSDPTELRMDVSGKVLNDYQEDFQTDETDAVSSEEQITQQLEALLGPDGWARAVSVEVTGGSSAEDEQSVDAGVQEPSEANTNLALQRALLTTKPVVEAFASHGVDVHQMVEKEDGAAPEPMLSVRGIEDSWSDGGMKIAEGYVTDFGYDSVDDMVTRYNDNPDAAPPAVQEFLKPLMDDQRGAVVTVKLRGGDPVSFTIRHEGTRIVFDELTKQVTETKPTVNPTAGFIPEQAPVVKPWERVSKDAAFRGGQRAPQGNGAKPLRFGGGVPFNPTPSNFS